MHKERHHAFWQEYKLCNFGKLSTLENCLTSSIKFENMHTLQPSNSNPEYILQRNKMHAHVYQETEKKDIHRSAINNTKKTVVQPENSK